jgi:capsular exopolysaccharide synthesis family protein
MDSTPTLRAARFREAHLRDYWRVVWQGRWTVVGVFFLVVGAVALYTFLQAPVYRATATVEIQPKSRRLLASQDMSGMGAAGLGWFAEEKYHNTQVEIIKSRDVSLRVVELLDLDEHPRFENAIDPVEAFRGLIQVDPRRETGLIEVSIDGGEPQEIARWVNAVSQAYVDRNLEQAQGNLRQAIDAVGRQLIGLQDELSEAEDVRLDKLQETEIFDSEGQTEIVRQNLQKYNTELTQVLIEINRLSETLRQARTLAASGRDLMSLQQLAEDAALQELQLQRDQVERQLEAAKAELKSGHPHYDALENELAEANQSVQDRMTAIIEGLEKRRDHLVRHEGYLRDQIARAERFSLDLAKATSSYDIIKTDSDVKKQILDLITQTTTELQLGAELMNNNVIVLDEAVPPLFPIKPRKRVNLMIGAMFGLFLGVGAVFFLDYLDNTIRTSEDVERYLGLTVLGIVPKMQDKGMAQRAIREAFQSLRTSIIFSSKNRSRRLVLITSNGPREGKSSTVANLARTLAAAGERVMVLDCDLRRPTQHLAHNLERDHGLTNYLAAPVEETDWEQYVKPGERPNLHILSCGPIPPSPPELLGNERMRDLLSQLRDRYDWVLIDSPPAASLTDASILASLADMVVIVIQHNRTDRDLAIKTVSALRSVNDNLVGAVLNNVDIDRAAHKDYYLAGYYYYTEDEEAGTGRRKKKVEKKVQVG